MCIRDSVDGVELIFDLEDRHDTIIDFVAESLALVDFVNVAHFKQIAHLLFRNRSGKTEWIQKDCIFGQSTD